MKQSGETAPVTRSLGGTRPMIIIGVSMTAHLGLLWGCAWLLSRSPKIAEISVYAVEIIGESAVKEDPPAVAWTTPRKVVVPRLGERTSSHTARSSDSLRRTAASGTETGRAAAAPCKRALAGGDLDDMRYRPYDHRSRNTPQRIRTRRLAVTHDNRRATPHPAASAHLTSQRGDSARRAQRTAPKSAASPQTKRGVHPRDPGRLAFAAEPGVAGKLALRSGQQTQPQRSERLTRLPKDGAVAPRFQRPRVPKDLPATETRRKRRDVADSKNRRQASSKRVPDLLDMARPSATGQAKGHSNGSVSGRPGDAAGRKRGVVVWLNTRDTRYVDYFRRIHEKIQPLWRFPKGLEILMEQGDVLVEFVLRPDGRLGRSKVRRSSGYPAFDKNALAAIRRAAPFPSVPAGLGAPLTILAPFEFANPLIR